MLTSPEVHVNIHVNIPGRFSSTSQRFDELQHSPVVSPLLRVHSFNPEHPSAIAEKSKYFIMIVLDPLISFSSRNYFLPIADAKSHPEDALAWLIKAKRSAGTKRI